MSFVLNKGHLTFISSKNVFFIFTLKFYYKSILIPFLFVQNKVTTDKHIALETSAAQEQALLYEQSDLRIEVVELNRLAAIKVPIVKKWILGSLQLLNIQCHYKQISDTKQKARFQWLSQECKKHS